MSQRPDPAPLQRELRFSDRDMELFAAASGDRSPLHTDPAFARRTAYGECIVYGGLLTVAMLGLLPVEFRSRIRSVRSVFGGPVLPGARCIGRAQSRPGRPDDWEVRLSGRGKVLARVMASAAGEAPGMTDRAEMLARATAAALPVMTDRAEAPAGARAAALRTPMLGDVAAGEGGAESLVAGLEIVGDYRPGAELLGLAARFGVQDLDPALLEGIAWASNVVGMTIPGFDGLCAAVTIVADGQGHGPARQWIRVRDYDTRTDRVLLDGALLDEQGLPRCFGLIECFPLRPTPLADAAVLTSDGPPEPVRAPQPPAQPQPQPPAQAPAR